MKAVSLLEFRFCYFDTMYQLLILPSLELNDMPTKSGKCGELSAVACFSTRCHILEDWQSFRNMFYFLLGLYIYNKPLL
jgi:hypothetical protein